jgi:hypothetical protein
MAQCAGRIAVVHHQALAGGLVGAVDLRFGFLPPEESVLEVGE